MIAPQSLVLAVCLTLALAGIAQAGTISGTVRNTSGDPVANTRVDAIEVVGSGYLLRKSVFTSATGAYSLDGLAAGTYLVRFEGNTLLQREYYANKASRVGSTQISVTATGTVTGIDAVLGHWPRIIGKVTDASTGLPVQNAIVIFGDSLAATRTAADGTYRLTLRDEAATSTDRLRFTDRDGQQAQLHRRDRAVAGAQLHDHRKRRARARRHSRRAGHRHRRGSAPRIRRRYRQLP
jgi:hypothetical protein